MPEVIKLTFQSSSCSNSY